MNYPPKASDGYMNYQKGKERFKEKAALAFITATVTRLLDNGMTPREIAEGAADFANVLVKAMNTQ